MLAGAVSPCLNHYPILKEGGFNYETVATHSGTNGYLGAWSELIRIGADGS